MRRRNTFMLIVFVCTLVIALVVGIKTKNSFIYDVNLKDYLNNESLMAENYDYFTVADYDVFKSYNDIAQLSELEKISDIIVKVKVEEAAIRLIYDGCVLSDCKVEKVYKGLIEQPVISVFEPVDCNNKEMVDLAEGYNLMDNGREYILFLNHIGNGTFSHGPDVYVFSTILYSKFDTNGETKARIYNEDILCGEILYKDCRSDEVLLPSQSAYKEVMGEEDEEYEKYECFYKLKKQVIKKYN